MPCTVRRRDAAKAFGYVPSIDTRPRSTAIVLRALAVVTGIRPEGWGSRGRQQNPIPGLFVMKRMKGLELAATSRSRYVKCRR
jgi:hypothetical protein